MMTATLGEPADAIAPDGSEVRLLVRCPSASMAHFTLAPGETSVAVSHRTLDELWFVLGGRGEMWRSTPSPDPASPSGDDEMTPLEGGVALAIPAGTRFQFRATGNEPLTAVATTMPPWPGGGRPDGRGEVDLVPGPWVPTVTSGLSPGRSGGGATGPATASQ